MVLNTGKFLLKTKRRKQKSRPMLPRLLPKKRLELRRRKLTERKLKRIGERKLNKQPLRGNVS